MLARLCGCERPLLLEPPACHRCGRDTTVVVSASTRRLAVALAEVMLGHRRIGDCTGRKRKTDDPTGQTRETR